MTLSDRFNQKPDLPYGRCADCDLELPTEEDAAAHRAATAGSIRKPDRSYKSSHATMATNPGRQESINRNVYQTVQSAVEDLMADLARLVEDDDATKNEVATALTSCYVNLSDEWSDQEIYKYEEDDEEENDDNA